MKKFLQFSGIIAAVIAIVSFILLLTCPALTLTAGSNTYDISATYGIFGGKVIESGWSWLDDGTAYKATATAIIAFLLLIVSIVILLVGVILPLFKVTFLNRFSGVLNLIAVLALVVAGVFIFVEVPCFTSAQGYSNADGYSLGAGWVVSGICAIAAGLIAIAPAFADFVAKGKKRK